MANVKISGITAGLPVATSLVEFETIDGLSRHCNLTKLMDGMPKVGLSGGNARGTGAVDWQRTRTDDPQVASGDYSFIGGGHSNTAPGAYSTVSGGYGNTASGNCSAISGGSDNTAPGAYSTVSGGYGNTASGNYSAISCGKNNTASGYYSAVSGGYGNTASGNYSAISCGNNNTASGYYSAVGGGYNNTASGYGSWCPGGGYANSRGISFCGVYGGVAQTSVLPLAAVTYDDTPTVLASTGSSPSATNQLVLPNNTSVFFEVDLIAHDDALHSAAWKVQGVARRGANAAATSIIGANITTPFGNDLIGGSPGVTVTADTTNGALAVTFTGIAATTIRPSAHIRTIEAFAPEQEMP